MSALLIMLRQTAAYTISARSKPRPHRSPYTKNLNTLLPAA